MEETKYYYPGDFVEYVGIVLFDWKDKRICVLKTGNGSNLDHFTLFKGSRRIHESRREAALRQVKEETGHIAKILPAPFKTRAIPENTRDSPRIKKFRPHFDDVLEDAPREYPDLEEHFAITFNPTGNKFTYWFLAVAEDTKKKNKKSEKLSNSTWVMYEDAIEWVIDEEKQIFERAIDIVDNIHEPELPVIGTKNGRTSWFKKLVILLLFFYVIYRVAEHKRMVRNKARDMALMYFRDAIRNQQQ